MFQKNVIPKMEEWIQWQNIKNEKNIEIIIHAIENIVSFNLCIKFFFNITDNLFFKSKIYIHI